MLNMWFLTHGFFKAKVLVSNMFPVAIEYKERGIQLIE